MDYDFKQLHDKEFESLCTDLFSECTGVRFERFKAGKDAGVDARYFTPNNKEVILQCKHWANTPISTLINTLEKAEKPKLERLNPRKYYLAISNPLSRKDKLKIYNALYPHIKVESDIFGKEDLNDLLKANPTIEKRHYKLWLHSTNMLNIVLNSAVTGRSEFEISEITSQSKKYVKTKNHNDAIHILEKLNVAIITGEPGIGKTTLANHICLQYISEGYELVKISADIRDGESVFTKDKKQLFYFDDFLGRNYLDALRGHEGSQITQFMRRVSASKDKKFLLTSRSTILNQGKILCDTFDHNNVQKNEFELKITSLSSKEKAEILYNHIWHSGLPEEFIDEIYKEQRYIKIINHKNFNPRLISHIIDSNRLEEVSKDNYWLHINESLSNPADIWENPFSSQLDDFGRILVLLVVLNGYPITENQLSNAYLKIISQPENQSFSGKRDFQINIKGGFNREVHNCLSN